jgi:hypothetical protein
MGSFHLPHCYVSILERELSWGSGDFEWVQLLINVGVHLFIIFSTYVHCDKLGTCYRRKDCAVEFDTRGHFAH